MKSMTDSRKYLVAIVVITLCTAIVFAYSASARAPMLGRTAWLDSWFAAASVLFAKNWTQSGTFQMGLGMFFNPASVETPNLADRQLYMSYPPGAIVPVYLISRVLGRVPSLELVMAWNMALQFLIALTICLLAFYVLRRAGMTWPGALLFALAPIPLMLLLPGPMYLHLVPYFSDQAVLLPLALFVLCETIRDETIPGSRPRRAVSLAQAVLLFAGVATEWVFVFLAGLTFLKRLAQGEYKLDRASAIAVAVYFFPLLLAIALFAVQVITLGGGHLLQERFGVQTGIDEGAFLNVRLDNHFWTRHVVRAYGVAGLWLIAASAAYIALAALFQLVRRVLGRDTAGLARLLWPAFLLLVPCVVHVIIFRNHSKYFLHYFGALKFCMPLALIPFVLLPAFMLRLLRLEGRRGMPVHIPLALCLLAAAWAYALFLLPEALKQIRPMPVPLGGPDAVARAQFIARSTNYFDVVFTDSDRLEINDAPLFLKDSMKRVYGVGDIEQIAKRVKDIQEDYVVNLLVKEETLPIEEPSLQRLFESAADVKTWSGYKLAKIPKARFLELVPRQ